MANSKKIDVHGTEILIYSEKENDYISLPTLPDLEMQKEAIIFCKTG